MVLCLVKWFSAFGPFLRTVLYSTKKRSAIVMMLKLVRTIRNTFSINLRNHLIMHRTFYICKWFCMGLTVPLKNRL